MHPFLVPPVRRMEGKARLPMIQNIGGVLTRQLQGSMLIRDALRNGGTSRTGISTSPMPAAQLYTVENAGGTNSPYSMRSGLRVRNASRVADKTRGQSAGI